MPTFLVERYAPGPWPALPGTPHRSAVAEAGSGTAREGAVPGAVRLVLSAAIPSDEIVLGLFEAPTQDALAAELDARGLPFIRIVEALVDDGRWDAGGRTTC